MWEGQTAVVAGGTGGLGSGITEALRGRSMRVLTLGRTGADIIGDFADEITAARVLDDIQPDLVVLCAGARPLLRPLHLHTWETFSQNWEVDAKAAFVWLRNALLLPMKRGSHVIVVSSAAAIHGSVLSGGYAGAKRTQWFIAKYAAIEAERAKLGINIHCLLPMLSPNGIGRPAIDAYAARAGLAPDDFAKRFDPPLTPAIMGQAVVDLHENSAKWKQVAYQIDGRGLTAVP
jgi:NAD(P)-dependent dehydrogenase (short-subunit alcohol dehydrogenase family)